MNNMKQVLSIEQMQHLQELGLDTSNASAEYYRMSEKMDWFLVFGCRSKEELLDTEENIPAYTLQDVLELLPKEIKPAEKRHWLRIDLADECIYYYHETIDLMEHRDKVFSYYGEELIDAAYNALCWCIENGYVESIKEE